jgi:hypothetical protein
MILEEKKIAFSSLNICKNQGLSSSSIKSKIQETLWSLYLSSLVLCEVVQTQNIPPIGNQCTTYPRELTVER